MTMIEFIIMGLLGATAYVFLWSKSFEDLKSFANVTRLIIGAIVGLVYSYLYSDWNFPNGVMCFVAGYMGPDFLQGILEKFKPKPKEELIN